MQVDELLKLMVVKGASDLHLTVPSLPVLRIDGELMSQEDLLPLAAKDIEFAFEKFLLKSKRQPSTKNGSRYIIQ